MEKVKSRRKSNAVAKDLRTPKYKMRVIESKLTYNRKKVENISKSVDQSL